MASVNVRKRKGRYEIRCRHQGKEKTIRLPEGMTKGRARNIANDVEVRWKTGDFNPWKNNLRFRDYSEGFVLLTAAIQSYIEDKTDTDWTTKGSVNQKSLILNSFVRRFPKTKLADELTTEDVQTFIDEQRAVETKKSYRSIIVAFINWMKKHEMTEHKFQLDRIRKGHETYPAIITEDELEDLITALKRFCRTKTKSKHVASKTHNTRWHYRHYYRILFYTGMRPLELTTIKVRDVNLASRIVRVGSEVPVKNKKERSVFLLDEILPTFEELTKGKRREDYLIQNRSMKRVSQTFRILADEIFPDRPDLVFYNLKHSCGCWMLEQGYSLESVTAQFGHADSRTTRIYAYMTNLALKNEFTRLKKNK